MLHELLFALCGMEGDVFHRVGGEGEASSTPSSAIAKDGKAAHTPQGKGRQRLVIPEDYPFLHPAERTSLESLADLGQQYHHLQSLICQGGHAPGPEAAASASAYRPALWAAIDAIPLARYRATVVEMERRLVDVQAEDCRGTHTPLAVLAIAFAKVRECVGEACV